MRERRAIVLFALALGLVSCPRMRGAARSDEPAAAAADLPSCSSVGTGSLPADERARCRKRWTVMLYLAADAPDLPAHAYADLRSIEESLDPALAAEVDVLVELDVDKPEGIRRYHMLPGTGPVPAGDELRTPAVMTIADESRPADAQLADFLDWGLRGHPARAYAVVVWGHGQGWRPRSATSEPVRRDPQGFVGGIAFDDSQHSVIDIPTLADRLDAATDAHLRGRPFDLLIVDACLMQSAEVDLALADTARFIVGHEQIDPYVGLPYDRLLSALPRAPVAASCVADDEACRVAVAIPELYRSSASTELDAAAQETYALSTVAAAPLRERLQPSLQALGAALVDYLDEDPLRAIDLQDMLSGEETPGFLGGTRDLGVVLARLRGRVVREADTPARAAVLAAIDEVRAALARTVLAVVSGGRYDDEAAVPAGLSVWLPHSPDEFAARGPSFATAPLHGGPWGAFITRTFTPPEP